MLANTAKQLGRLLGSKTSQQAAAAALPGAGINAAVGALIGGPKAAVGYAAGDFLLNYPLVGLARKRWQGTPGGTATILTKNGDEIIKEIPYMPSGPEQAVNFGASLLSAPLTDMVTGGSLLPTQEALPAEPVMPTVMSQEQQEYTQLMQRQQLNNLQTQALSPGTMYQMQGIEHTAFHYPGVTLPPDVLRQLQEGA
jgi:hypothetical protein